mmetsp:Transcript_29041/g.92935  ORF Transcript_29041/g.92935 Transcript_29041/m.92935 type:complete len:293 (-) Transcript_29041:4148-5026(-)
MLTTGVALRTMTVKESPPRLSARMRVSRESRKGMCSLRAKSAPMQRPSASSPRPMFFASMTRRPSAPLRLMFSEPLRSTRCRCASFTISPVAPGGPYSYTVCTSMVKMLCERLDWRLQSVSAVRRFCDVRLKISMMSCGAVTRTLSRPRTTTPPLAVSSTLSCFAIPRFSGAPAAASPASPPASSSSSSQPEKCCLPAPKARPSFFRRQPLAERGLAFFLGASPPPSSAVIARPLANSPSVLARGRVPTADFGRTRLMGFGARSSADLDLVRPILGTGGGSPSSFVARASKS